MSLFGFFGKTFRPQKPGRMISAKAMNRPVDAVNDLSRRRVSSGLVSMQAAGIQNERSVNRLSVWVRLIAASGGGGAYTWRGIYGVVGSPGTWLDLQADISDLGGTDLAYEVNGNASLVAGTRVEIKREWASGALVFLYDTCSTMTTSTFPSWLLKRVDSGGAFAVGSWSGDGGGLGDGSSPSRSGLGPAVTSPLVP